MAQIVKRRSKSGALSYLIRVSDGYALDGRQRRKSMTWNAPAGMSEKKADKEVQKQAITFEEQVTNGLANDGGIRLKDFAEKWMTEYVEKQLKIKTAHGYRMLLSRIFEALGHIRLRDLRTGHLNAFYANLQEDGVNAHTGGTLAANSVLAYHRCLSSMLSKAVKWGYISYNPATNAELPKKRPHEAPHLDETEARRLLELLHGEPIKWRAPITFDLLSGLRRGELLGLRWQDIDFDAQTITIASTLSYVPGRGLYTDTPKNDTSTRLLRLSRSAFLLLGEYRNWQDGQRMKCGTAWQNMEGRVFTGDDGAPIHPDALTKWFRLFVQRAGLPKVTVHSLRHTYASLMIADGTPLVVVSKRLGHAQVSTTANIYAHVIASADEKAAQITERFADVVFMPTEAEKKA